MPLHYIKLFLKRLDPLSTHEVNFQWLQQSQWFTASIAGYSRLNFFQALPINPILIMAIFGNIIAYKNLDVVKSLESLYDMLQSWSCKADFQSEPHVIRVHSTRCGLHGASSIRVFNYCNSVLHGTSAENIGKLSEVLNAPNWGIFGTRRSDHITSGFG